MFRIVLTIICADGKETTENMKKMKKNWVEISKLILSNLRWLDHIVDSSVLTEKIVDLLEGAPVQV